MGECSCGRDRPLVKSSCGRDRPLGECSCGGVKASATIDLWVNVPGMEMTSATIDLGQRSDICYNLYNRPWVDDIKAQICVAVHHAPVNAI